MTRVLIATGDTIGERMAGPAIRAWELAHVLASRHDVRLVTFGSCTRTSDMIGLDAVTSRGFRAAVADVDVVVIQGYLLVMHPWLRSCRQILVIDLYDPFHLETLEIFRHGELRLRRFELEKAAAELNEQVLYGDSFLCASQRQRQFWLGHLAAFGRINPIVYDNDPELGDLVRLVPFGVAEEPPVRTAAAIKGVVPGIAADNRVVLWAGGVYNWFDPLTVLRAVALAADRVPTIRLFFLGMKHPNPDVPEMAMAAELRRLSDEMGLTGRLVFFGDGWVPYERRADYLLDADIGVSAAFDHVESEFSFRTRMLDYFWSGLPVVCTAGDALADLVAARGAGAAVPAGDAELFAAALVSLLDDPARLPAAARASASIADDFRWSRIAQPLMDLCDSPAPAVDRVRRGVKRRPPIAPRWSVPRNVWSGFRSVRYKGVGATVGAVGRRLRR